MRFFLNSKVLKLLILTLTVFLFFLPKSFADTIKINGVVGPPLANIKARLTELSEQGNLDKQSDSQLQDQISKALNPFGYFNPKVKLYRGNHQLTVYVRAGPRLRINKLILGLTGEGKTNPAIIKVLAKLDLQEGAPFNSQQYSLSKQTLMNAAEHQGYLHASFDKAEVLIDAAKNYSSISLVLNTGKQFFFGRVRFDPTYISPDLLHRFVPFKPGQSYSTDQILEFNNALSGSGYFKAVTVVPENTDSATIPINVHLQPAARTHYSIGLGYGTDTKARGRLGLHVIPVNRAGHKFSAIALGSFNESSLQAQYIIPGKQPLRSQFEIIANVSDLDYNSGKSTSGVLTFAHRYNAPKFQRTLSINNLYERFNYTSQPIEKQFNLYPKASFTWLSSADKLFSPSGYKVNINALGASQSLLSSKDFLQMAVDAKFAITVQPIRTRFFFHTIQARTYINEVSQLPLSLALLLGGADNLKGFSYNAIGPGKKLAYGGLEIQKETKDNWYLIAFIDRGDVYDPLPRVFKKDIGIGAMWVSPVGPIKIGLAKEVDAHFNPKHTPGPKLVISMGPDL